MIASESSNTRTEIAAHLGELYTPEADPAQLSATLTGEEVAQLRTNYTQAGSVVGTPGTSVEKLLRFTTAQNLAAFQIGELIVGPHIVSNPDDTPRIALGIGLWALKSDSQEQQ